MSAEILLVDDDPRILDIVGTSLGRRGYKVSTAVSGGQALESAQERRPELIILDLGLPDMTGIQVLEKVRGAVEPDTPILFISGDSDVEARVSALAGGAEDFILKPLQLSELHARIEGALRRCARIRTLGKRNVELAAKMATESERSSREFKRHILSMRTLLSMSNDLNRAMESEQLVKVASLTLLGELQASSMALFGVERENADKFHLLGVRGFDARRFEGLVINRSSNFAVLLEKEQRAQRIARNPDQRWVRSLPDLRLAVFEHATPILVKGTMKGVVFIGPKLSGEPYTEYEMDIITFIANSVGIGIQNAHLVTQLQTTYVSTLRSLISIIEAKDAYTRGHTERVAAYAIALANRMGVSEEDLRHIMFGALMHDIGKMGVLDEIVKKPGALTEEEWELMRAHPVVGARIVEKMEFLTGTVAIVRHHHEKWNGGGYPDGLRGRDIPFGARILTVADSFDAMTTDRPYRKALSLEEALNRLKEASGEQFDPELVEVFTRYIRDRGTALAVAPAEDNEDL